MTYTVIWVKRAEDELAEIWLAALDRNAVTQAAHEIDRRLRRDPVNEGESRTANQRVTFVAPLGALFDIDEDDRKVHVLQAWVFTTTGSGG